MAQGFLLVGRAGRHVLWGVYVVSEGLALELEPAGKGVFWKVFPCSKPLLEQARAFC